MRWMINGSGPTGRRRDLGLGFATLCLLALVPQALRGQGLDICGCESFPSRGAFVASDPATFEQAGATQLDTGCGVSLGNLSSLIRIEFQVPEDGILVFDSFVASNDDGTNCAPLTLGVAIVFQRPQSNAPVRIFVKGDFTLGSGGMVYVAGTKGSAGAVQRAGMGGAPGVGGFAGGDAAFLTGNLASDGGAGIGPGGGLGGNASDPNAPVLAGGGIFFGVDDLRPMIGGSGGGGGYSTGCAGGGGGGGGGALQIVANGEIRVDGQISADGGSGGGASNSSCASAGARGSGGSILLIADTISGAGRLYARLGGVSSGGLDRAGDGRVRMEAVTNTFSGTADPVAIQVTAPGPAQAATNPTVAITHVAGALTPQPPDYPQGFTGEIDMVVSQPGIVTFSFEAHEVPSGTDLAVAVKPSVGGDPKERRVTLAASKCGGGVCTAEVGIPLEPGAYVAEARATFEVPASP